VASENQQTDSLLVRRPLMMYKSLEDEANELLLPAHRHLNEHTRPRCEDGVAALYHARLLSEIQMVVKDVSLPYMWQQCHGRSREETSPNIIAKDSLHLCGGHALLIL